jgi:pSer/pThr/pTyr-binding forkhead associated (FHA) protein
MGRFVIQATQATLPIPPGKMEVLIGREDPVSGVFPEINLDPHNGVDNGVGRTHAKLTTMGGQVYIEDLNSVNKTRLRGQVLTPNQKQPLNTGDEIMLGKMKLIYYSS